MYPGHFLTHLLYSEYVHSVGFIEGDGLYEVQVGIGGCCSVGLPTDIRTYVRTPEYLGRCPEGIAIVAAVDHGNHIDNKQNATEHITALSVLERAVFEVSDIDFGFFFCHTIIFKSVGFDFYKLPILPLSIVLNLSCMPLTLPNPSQLAPYKLF